MAYDDGEGLAPAPLEEPQLASTVPCWRCGGQGHVRGRGWGAYDRDCPRCEGTGVDPGD